MKNPSEDKDVVEITNYIDLGLEFTARNDKDKPTENGNFLFQLAASWQANKNFLLKVKFHLPFTPSCLVFKECMTG